MVIFDLISVLLLIACCTVASVCDIRFGKIPNRLIGTSLIVGTILSSIHYAVLSRNQALAFLINAGGMVVIAAVLYCARIWAGGDCKLLLVIAVLFPAEWYWSPGSISLAFCCVMGFMFVCGFVYLLAETIILLIKDLKSFSLKSYLTDMKTALINYSKTIVVISAISHIYLQFISPYYVLPSILYSLLCIAIVSILGKLHYYDTWIISAVLLVFDITMTIITGRITVNVFWFSYVIVLIFMMIRTLIGRYNYQTIPTNEIRAGMIVSTASSILFQRSGIKGLPVISDESLHSRLTQNEADSIRRWGNSKGGLSEICIVRKIPFAIFMLCGLLLYLIVGVLI